MDKLGDSISRNIQEQATVPKMMASVLARKLLAVGLSLNEKGLAELARQVEKYQESNLLSKESDPDLILDLKQEWLANDAMMPKAYTQTIRLTSQDIEAFREEFMQNIKSITANAPIDAGDELLLNWKKEATKHLKREKRAASSFNNYLSKKWGKALNLLELLIVTLSEAGSTFNKTYHVEAAQNDDAVFYALIHLHARGCQVSREVLVLLQNGLADGAHGRWRTLQEIAVTASFILKYGNEVAIRYLYHADIDTFNEMEKHNKYYEKLGWQPIPEQDFKDMETHCQGLTTRFGPGFDNPYGWAANALGNKKPNLQDIEENAGLEHLRPFYKIASQNVHASSRGTFHRLAKSPSKPNLLVAGPSIFGLGDPGRNTAYSITLLTGALLRHKLSYDHLAFLHAATQLRQEVHDAFYEAETSVK